MRAGHSPNPPNQSRRRIIFVEPGDWGGIGELKNLILPPDANRVIVSVHCYEFPFFFTHQGAGWTDLPKVTGVQSFPALPPRPSSPTLRSICPPACPIGSSATTPCPPPDQNPSSPIAFESRLKYIRAWSDYYARRPIHLGEVRAYSTADAPIPRPLLLGFPPCPRGKSHRLGHWGLERRLPRYWDKKHNHRPMPGNARRHFSGIKWRCNIMQQIPLPEESNVPRMTVENWLRPFARRPRALYGPRRRRRSRRCLQS